MSQDDNYTSFFCLKPPGIIIRLSTEKHPPFRFQQLLVAPHQVALDKGFTFPPTPFVNATRSWVASHGRRWWSQCRGGGGGGGGGVVCFFDGGKMGVGNGDETNLQVVVQVVEVVVEVVFYS